MLTFAEKTEPAVERTRVRVTTAKSTKAPWDSVKPRTIEIPKHWVTELYTSNNMAAFVARTTKAFIPLDGRGDLLRERDIKENGWLLLDELYRTHAGAGRHTPPGLIDQIDHLRKLSVQLPLEAETQRKLVLYPKSGDLMRAARRESGSGIVENTLFWYQAPTRTEAAYLTVLLNTNCLQSAYAGSRQSGRDFQVHPWRRVPIPRYDQTVALHREIAGLCTQAEQIAATTVNRELKDRPGKGQVALTKAVRNALAAAGVDAKMDECARQLMPKHAQS